MLSSGRPSPASGCSGCSMAPPRAVYWRLPAAPQRRACSNKAVPNRQSPPHAWLGARHALRRSRSRAKLWAWAFQRPHTSEPSTTSVCGPLRTRVCGTLAALGHAQHGAVHGRCAWLWGPRSRERGHKRSVAALRSPAVLRAPCTTRSSLRRSCVPTCGAVVWANHCCGTTCPSDPIASRATRTCFTILARLARSPVRGHASAWSPNAVQRQRLSQATPQSELRSGRWEHGGRLGLPAVLPGIAEVLDNWAACQAGACARGSDC